MRRLKNHLLGIDQGEVSLFSDFEDGGDMWTGHGERERRQSVAFSTSFRSVPVVQVGLSLYDIDSSTNIRADVKAEQITGGGFDIVFRTWGDTRIARVRVNWIAFGELPLGDEWDQVEV